MAHANGTVVHSKVSKSIACEQLVCDELIRRGFTLLTQREKIKGCEIDLIFYQQDEILLVEVKCGFHERVLERWQQDRQRIRQQKVVRFCLERGFKVRWWLAAVHKSPIQYWDLLDMV